LVTLSTILTSQSQGLAPPSMYCAVDGGVPASKVEVRLRITARALTRLQLRGEAPTVPAILGQGLRHGEDVGSTQSPGCSDYGRGVGVIPELRGARCRIPR
jgi:hypothetical protein